MKRLCIRCGNEMSDGGPETRNLCENCIPSVDDPVRISLPEFLESVAVPVILFDSERKAVAANQSACEYLGKSPGEVEGFKGGDVFDCRYAHLPEGCGNTIHCSGCTIRRLIMDTLILDKEHERVPVYLNRHDSSEKREPDFMVSTEKKFSLVLLKIDTVRAESDALHKG